jgi:hypothetical protein
VKEYLATLDDPAWGAASDVVPKFVSPSDPAAQWTGAHTGPAFFAYSDNYLIDVKFGVIVDVEALANTRTWSTSWIKHTSRRIQSNINNQWLEGCPVNSFILLQLSVLENYGPIYGREPSVWTMPACHRLFFSSCVRDSTKPAIRDRNSSMDGMSISNAT